MRVGILDILSLPSRGLSETISHWVLTKQYAGVTPQAVSVWCRQLGHDVHYAAYFGVGDPGRLLPRDLDVLFIACYTQASALGYALSQLYRRGGTLTVLGGPHAKAFPHDCLRFFDLVVQECDKQLIGDILNKQFAPGSIISSESPLEDIPTVEERMPEILRTAFFNRRWRSFMTTVPMLASVGCPYNCNFCIDWDNPYRMLPAERLAEDLKFLAKRIPGGLIAFHDPNFGVRFDETLDVLEALPKKERPPYIMESSLSILKGNRVSRLADTNCVAVAPGIESWAEFSKKAGAGHKEGAGKVTQVADHFAQLYEHVPYLQANFIFGLDTDAGEGPVELSCDFMDRTPYVWPTLNIPVPFGGTPLYDIMLSEKRILESMPFSFYYAPYLVTTIKNYEPAEYYRRLIRLFEFCASRDMLRRRLKASRGWQVGTIHRVRTAFTRQAIGSYRRILDMLENDRQFLDFHTGKTQELPEFYYREQEMMLGRYAELLSKDDLKPDLRQHEAPEPIGPLVSLTGK